MRDIITNQRDKEYQKIKYGLFPVSYNGCAIIAVYNAFILLGIEPPEFVNLVKRFWSLYLSVLFGWWGSNAYRVHRVLESYGLSYRQVDLADMRKDGIYILTLWNKKPPIQGMHTVACAVKAGKSTTYNMYSNAGVTNEPLELLVGKRLIRAYQVYVE